MVGGANHFHHFQDPCTDYLLVIPVLLCFQSLHLVHFVCRVSPNSKLFQEIMTIKERKVGSIKKMLTK
jgi:hypothetical protein